MLSGVINDVTECPQCSLPCSLTNYYVTREETVTCNWCGYSHTKTINGKETKGGYGSIHYVSKNNAEEERIVRIKKPMSLVECNSVIMDINNNYNKEKSSFYIWRGTYLECLLGTQPTSIEERYQEQLIEQEYEESLKHLSSSDTDECYPF